MTRLHHDIMDKTPFNVFANDPQERTQRAKEEFNFDSKLSHQPMQFRSHTRHFRQMREEAWLRDPYGSKQLVTKAIV